MMRMVICCSLKTGKTMLTLESEINTGPMSSNAPYKLSWYKSPCLHKQLYLEASKFPHSCFPSFPFCDVNIILTQSLITYFFFFLLSFSLEHTELSLITQVISLGSSELPTSIKNFLLVNTPIHLSLKQKSFISIQMIFTTANEWHHLKLSQPKICSNYKSLADKKIWLLVL